MTSAVWFILGPGVFHEAHKMPQRVTTVASSNQRVNRRFEADHRRTLPRSRDGRPKGLISRVLLECGDPSPLWNQPRLVRLPDSIATFTVWRGAGASLKRSSVGVT